MPPPIPTQVALQHAEIGILYHLDLTIYREDRSDHSAGDPASNSNLFYPTRLDTDQWVAATKAVGAK